MSLLLDALKKAAESKNRHMDGGDSDAHDQDWLPAEHEVDRSNRPPHTAGSSDAAQGDELARGTPLRDSQDIADQTIPPPIPGFDLPAPGEGERTAHGESASNDAASDSTLRQHSDAELARRLHTGLRPESDEEPGEREADTDDAVEQGQSDGISDSGGSEDERDADPAMHRPSAFAPSQRQAPSQATPSQAAAGHPARTGPSRASAAADALYDEFDDTQQLEPKRLGDELRSTALHGTPDQARNLFTSKSVRKPIRQRPSALLLALALVSLAAVGAWLYYGYGEHQFALQRDLARIRSSAPIQPDPPSAAQNAAVRAEAEANSLPRVAAVDASSGQAPAGEAETAAQITTGVIAGVDTGGGDADGADATPAPSTTEPPAVDAEVSANDVASSAPPESRSLQSATQSGGRTGDDDGVSDNRAGGDAPATVSDDAPQTSQSPAPQSPASRAGDVATDTDSAPRNGSLSIARSRREAPIDQLIKSGYDAYQVGRLDAAGAHYREALGIDRNHRDALLGAAAVALREGNGADAARYYQHLLHLNPRDPAALVGLHSLSRSGDPAQLETELSLLLERAPESAPLHFALGGVYSRGRRWAKAQQAYFNAHRLDAGNPDYLYNLAISLDNLGKRDAAADFYRQALEAARLRAANFDQNTALMRFHALQGVQ